MINKKLPEFYFGGDYNPDQWPEELLDDDIRQMKIHNVNVVTIPIFSWANLQPSEEKYNFLWLDAVLDKLYENGIYFIMATPTAAQPAWMSKRYPDILPVDVFGRKRKHGGRSNFCPNSTNYRRFSRNIAEVMAKRYKNHPGLLMWHINNEYGPYCYCDKCSEAFRTWLQKKYKTLDELNNKWYTKFWGHTFYEWDEIEAVSGLNELLPNRLKNRDGTNFQGMAVDYRRFMSDSILDCFLNEKEVIIKHTPEVPVTTNIWGIAPLIDLFKWAEHTDISSWDNYPSNDDHPSIIAMRHDIIRGLKGGQPFLIMEQTPNQQNWQDINALKRPGVMRLTSYQAVAHGADGVLFFQWRQSIGACEKYHAAFVPHAGHENTRIGRELSQLGNELNGLGDKISGSRINSRVAIIIDWSNWWALEYSSGPSIHLKYIEQVEKYYKAFYSLNIPVDFIKPADDLSKYDIVVAPVLYMVGSEVSNKIEKFVSCGGTFITTFFSGIVDENDLVILGGYPGSFRKLLGIWVEETDAIYPDKNNEIFLKENIGDLNETYKCGLICDVLHSEGAKVIATYGKDYYKGYPCITENSYGKGKAVYVATEPEEKLLKEIAGYYTEKSGIKPDIKPCEGIEITQRVKGEKKFTFILNHNESETEVTLSDGKYIDIISGEEYERAICISAKGVLILDKV